MIEWIEDNVPTVIVVLIAVSAFLACMTYIHEKPKSMAITCTDARGTGECVSDCEATMSGRYIIYHCPKP